MGHRFLRFALGAAAGLGLALAPVSHGKDASYAAIQKGRYLVRAGDCAACHTADDGKPFAGGRPIPTPFGVIYAPNITPDKDTGIGAWSDDDFYRAMHRGIDRQGNHLYPAFPYPWYTKLSRDDVLAIKAFLDTLEPVQRESKANELPWPLSWRGAVAGWNTLYFKEGSYKPDAGKSAQWNRGAYLVEGLGHCGACHSPKNALGAPYHDRRLQGGFGEHWYAPSLAGDLRAGLGNWSADEIVEYLKTGVTRRTAAAGPMAEVIKNSTQYLDESDLRAIATYLKDMPRVSASETEAKADKETLSHGEALYVDNCIGCHMLDGAGQPDVFPALKGNSAVQAKDPTTVLQIILGGGHAVATNAKPNGLAMPAFGWKLSDQEVADLATYVRNAWGNRAPAVSSGNAADVRHQVRQAAAQ